MKLTSRSVRLTAYRVRAGYFDTEQNGVEITGLRVRFKVERRLGSAADTCAVTISNLAEQSRADLETHPLQIILEAGYDGELRRLFAGDMRWASSAWTGTGYETTIQVADGARALKNARVSRTFREGTTVKAALAEVARSMGLKLPRELTVSPELEEQFAAGTTLEGFARDELTRLLAPYGYDWTIQDGTLYAYRDDQVRGGEALVISEETGMVESPTFTPPTQSAKKSKSVRRSTLRAPRLNVRTLLYPQVVPGVKLEIDSLATRGIYKAVQVSHEGDTHGPDFTTTIEAKAL